MYHISPETGRPNKCYAVKRACPIASQHFETKEDARAAYEKTNLPVATPLKKKNKTPVGDLYETEDVALPGFARYGKKVTHPKLSITTDLEDTPRGWKRVISLSGEKIATVIHRESEEIIYQALEAGMKEDLKKVLELDEELDSVSLYRGMNPAKLKEEYHGWEDMLAHHPRLAHQKDALKEIELIEFVQKLRRRSQ